MPDGGTLRITNAGTGGRLDSSSFFDVGSVGTGTLIVVGSTAAITASSISDWGRFPGDHATISFGIGGAGTYSTLRLGNDGGTATVSLQSGARLTTTSSLQAGNGAAGSIVRIIMSNSATTLRSLGSATLRGGTIINYSTGSFSVANTLSMSEDAELSLTPGGNKVPRVGGLIMSGTSKIDLANNDMIIDYFSGGSPLAEIRQLIKTGRNGGDWLGNGITSLNASLDPRTRRWASPTWPMSPAPPAGRSPGNRSIRPPC